MTHNDVYTKFLIQYDKANVTSSYPSLTKYEIATLLDKAYIATIAQKVTGNNPRQSAFESDVKSIADVQPLIKHADLEFDPLSHEVMGINIAEVTIPEDYMYYVQMLIEYDSSSKDGINVGDASIVSSAGQQFSGDDDNGILDVNELYYGNPDEMPDQLDWRNLYYSSTIGDPINSIAENSTSTTGPYDKKQIRLLPVKLTSHDVAEKFLATPYNMPWVKQPVAYMQSNKISIIYDPIDKPLLDPGSAAHLVYIHKPALFAIERTEIVDGTAVVKKDVDFSETTQFELLDTAAEEVINLAIIMALDNVESARLNSKLSMRGLES